MSADIVAIRKQMADRLGGISGALVVYEQVPNNPTMPCLIIYPPEQINYRATRRLDIVTFTVLALVGPLSPTAQEVLEGLMSSVGELSILAKLYEDPTLGETTNTLRLIDMTSGAYSFTTGNDINVVGAEFRVEVSA